MPAKDSNLNGLQNQAEKSIRELKVKIETIETHVQRTKQEIIERGQLADKYKRYADKESNEANKRNFRLQEEKALKEKLELQKMKKQLLEGLGGLQQVYDKIEEDYQQTINRIRSMNSELKVKQTESNLGKDLKQLEEETMRKLLEAEALLELRKDPY